MNAARAMPVYREMLSPHGEVPPWSVGTAARIRAPLGLKIAYGANRRPPPAADGGSDFPRGRSSEASSKRAASQPTMDLGRAADAHRPVQRSGRAGPRKWWGEQYAASAHGAPLHGRAGLVRVRPGPRSGRAALRARLPDHSAALAADRVQ